MSTSEVLRRNADDCAFLADLAQDEFNRKRYQRMNAAWLALADLQDWLDGKPTAPELDAPFHNRAAG
jgi:hypothetical protein